MKKIIPSKLAHQLITKPAESIKGNPKAKTTHLDLCHFDIPGDEHFDVPHSDTTWNYRKTIVKVGITGLSKDKLVSFAKLGVKIEGNEMVIPVAKLEEVKKIWEAK